MKIVKIEMKNKEGKDKEEDKIRINERTAIHSTKG
jgi:hypothetical protein